MDDVDRQISHDIRVRVKEGQVRFDQSFATLCFAALALSLQFSERANSALKPVLVVAWGLYLVAALLAGWRLMTTPQFDKISWAKNYLDSFLKQRRIDLKDPGFAERLGSGELVDSDTGEPATQDGIAEGIQKGESSLREALAILAALQRKFGLAFRACVLSLIVALLLNGLYLAVNFLR